MRYTVHDLQCFDAVVKSGSFQAAAAVLNRSHPSVFAAVAKLERQLGLALLDRSGYRVRLTETGSSFHRRLQGVMHELESLDTHAAQLAMGEESDLHVVVGDLCPRPEILQLLSRFFARHPATRFHLHFEAVTGPWEQLYEGGVDLIFHGIDKNDSRADWIDLCRINFIPVVAPGFLPFEITADIRPEQMRGFTQCILRDTARHSQSRDYYLIDGAAQCTVADHNMKKEIILAGMAWGHLPDFLIEDELRRGSLISVQGRYLSGSVEELVVARHANRPHGPVAEAMWNFMLDHAPLPGLQS